MSGTSIASCDVPCLPRLSLVVPLGTELHVDALEQGFRKFIHSGAAFFCRGVHNRSRKDAMRLLKRRRGPDPFCAPENFQRLSLLSCLGDQAVMEKRIVIRGRAAC